MMSGRDKWESLCNFIYRTEWSSEHVLRKEAEADKETLKFIQDDIAKNGKCWI